jgi:hypothetical protein
MIDGDGCGAVIGKSERQGKPKYPEKTCRKCRCAKYISDIILAQARTLDSAMGNR